MTQAAWRDVPRLGWPRCALYPSIGSSFQVTRAALHDVPRRGGCCALGTRNAGCRLGAASHAVTRWYGRGALGTLRPRVTRSAPRAVPRRGRPAARSGPCRRGHLSGQASRASSHAGNDRRAFGTRTAGASHMCANQPGDGHGALGTRRTGVPAGRRETRRSALGTATACSAPGKSPNVRGAAPFAVSRRFRPRHALH